MATCRRPSPCPTPALWPHLAALSYAGNPREADKLQYVKCWDDARSIFIRVGDSCPCQQKKPDGTTQPQFWCCGGNNHMDLNYWCA
jgi:cullin-associated NEDD8-dissociated protein 1